MTLNFFRHKKLPATSSVYKTLALSFFGFSTVIALAIFYVSFSWATITIVPRVQPITHTARIAIQESAPQDQSVLLGRIIQRDLEGTGIFTPTASETKPGRMSGVVTVVNRTAHSQVLRATTRFLTKDQVLFRSIESVVVPARGQIDVPIRAEKDGDLGTIDTSRFVIPGLWEPLQDEIYGASFTETQGGELKIRTVTRDDIVRAEQDVVKKLEEKFALLVDAEKSSFAASAVGVHYRSDITARTASNAVDEQVDQFTVRLSVRFTAVLYDEGAMHDLISQSMNAQLSTGYQLLNIEPDTYKGSLESIDLTQRKAVMIITAKGGKIRTDDVRSYHTRDLSGLKKDAIIEYFRGYDDIKDVSVSFSPFWVTRAPLLVDHIKIIVDKSAQ